MVNSRNILLTLHILFAMFTLGWLVMQAMFTPRAIREGNTPVVKFSHRVSSILGPTAIVVLLLGIALVLRSKSDNIDFSDRWVGLAILLFVIAMVNGAVFIRRAEQAAVAKLESGQPAPGEASRVSMLAGINALLVLVILFLMVAKPGGY
jgi:uncharacterized membrane protein